MEASSRTLVESLVRAPTIAPALEFGRLAESIERLVQRRTGGKIQGLKVEVQREGIRLQGRCPTFYCKQLAQHAAMDLTPDRVLTNEIEVG